MTVASYIGWGISLLLGEGWDGGGAYVQDKNTSAVLCAKNAGGAYTLYVRGGAYLRDTTVCNKTPLCLMMLTRSRKQRYTTQIKPTCTILE